MNLVEVVSAAPPLRHPRHEDISANRTLAVLLPGECLSIQYIHYGKDFKTLQVKRFSGEIGRAPTSVAINGISPIGVQ